MEELIRYAEANHLNVIFIKQKKFIGNYRNTKEIIGLSSKDNLLFRKQGLDKLTTVFIIDDSYFNLRQTLKHISLTLFSLCIDNQYLINSSTIKII